MHFRLASDRGFRYHERHRGREGGVMKLSGLILVSAFAGALSVLGCGDDGARSASEVCQACDNQDLRGACESTYDNCLNVDRGGSEECTALGLAACGI